MIENIETVLLNNGYKPVQITGDVKGYRIYTDQVHSTINVVTVIDALSYSDELIQSFEQGFKKKMEEINFSIHFMLLVLVNSASDRFFEQMTIGRQLCERKPFAWIYDEYKKELIIYENQASDFYGLKEILISASDVVPVSPDTLISEKKSPAYAIKRAYKSLPKATSLLVLINILVFVICTFTGSVLYNKGGVGIKLLTGPSQIYRLFTSMFLHVDSAHIFSNMILLYFLGEIVEKEMGWIWYTVLYFLSGIWGCLFTFISEIITGHYVVVIGASGAVFGILGALLSLVIFGKVHGRTLQFGRVFIVIIFSLYEGFTQANVANWAHIGGLFSGFIIGVIFSLVTQSKRGQKNED